MGKIRWFEKGRHWILLDMFEAPVWWPGQSARQDWGWSQNEGSGLTRSRELFLVAHGWLWLQGRWTGYLSKTGNPEQRVPKLQRNQIRKGRAEGERKRRGSIGRSREWITTEAMGKVTESSKGVSVCTTFFVAVTACLRTTTLGQNHLVKLTVWGYSSSGQGNMAAGAGGSWSQCICSQ